MAAGIDYCGVAVTDGSYIQKLYPNLCSCAFILEWSEGGGRIFRSFLEQSSVAYAYWGELLGLLAKHLILPAANKLLSWICRRHVACRDIIVDFGVDSQSTATFCCAWHVIRCQCKKCVSNMSIVIDIDSWADIKWCQCKNVSDVLRRVTCVSGVCQLWGDIPTDGKTTYPLRQAGRYRSLRIVTLSEICRVAKYLVNV
jgi:hypothetical protein